MRTEFIADRVKISGPRVDGSYSITFEVGEYQWDNIKELPNLNDELIYIKVTNDKENSQKTR